ncbi:unnamed protein product, partial [marine sediment metagenome]
SASSSMNVCQYAYNESPLVHAVYSKYTMRA